MAASGDAVWALRPDGVVSLLDERTARVRRRIRLPTAGAGRIAAAGDVAWVTSSADGKLWRVRRDGSVRASDVGSGAADVAADAGSAWVANPIDGTITGVSARTGRRTRTIDVGGVPRSLAVAGSTVWAAVGGGGRAATRTRVTGVEPLPASMCEPAIAGPGGAADVLVVSDLPLQGGVRITATQMAQAISFVLRERGFRGGRWRVAYQSCDDSVARTGLFDEAKCAANARAYRARADVVAVIGTLNSPCAVAAVPELNRARGGPLAMVSPLNSFVGLTRRAPGIPSELPDALYPTGRRNYLRVFPTDDLQTAALALLMRERGRTPVFALDDGDPGYGGLMATSFATAASRVGLRVAGRATWDPQARSYRRLAKRVEASGARAVFVGGLIDSNAAAVVRALRARLGPDVTLLGPDGLTPLVLLREQAGPAARDMLVTLPGAVTERLPPAGEAFARRFARAQPGTEIEPSAVYTAQATEVVLDALARSDGTRASVLDALFRTRLRDRLTGDVAFDARGDIVEAPVTVLRVTDDAGSRGAATARGRRGRARDAAEVEPRRRLARRPWLRARRRGRQVERLDVEPPRRHLLGAACAPLGWVYSPSRGSAKTSSRWCSTSTTHNSGTPAAAKSGGLIVVSTRPSSTRPRSRAARSRVLDRVGRLDDGAGPARARRPVGHDDRGLDAARRTSPLRGRGRATSSRRVLSASCAGLFTAFSLRTPCSSSTRSSFARMPGSTIRMTSSAVSGRTSRSPTVSAMGGSYGAATSPHQPHLEAARRPRRPRRSAGRGSARRSRASPGTAGCSRSAATGAGPAL